MLFPRKAPRRRTPSSGPLGAKKSESEFEPDAMLADDTLPAPDAGVRLWLDPAPLRAWWLGEKNEDVFCVAIDKFDEVLTSTSPRCEWDAPERDAGSVILALEEDDHPPPPPPDPEELALIPIPCAHLRPILSTVRLAMPAAAEPTPMLIAVCRKDDGLLLGGGCSCARAAVAGDGVRFCGTEAGGWGWRNACG